MSAWHDTNSAPATTATSLDLLHDIHIGRTTSGILVEHNIALGCNGVGGWSRLHASTLESTRGFEGLLSAGGNSGLLAVDSPIARVDLAAKALAHK